MDLISTVEGLTQRSGTTEDVPADTTLAKEFQDLMTRL
jgi:hypothetical protein